jgi:hypothetical protein
VSSIIFDSNGRPASNSPAFPLNPPAHPRAGIDPVTGNPAPIDPNATMGVRATAHSGTSRVVVAGNKAAWDALDQGSKFQSVTDLARASGTVGTATRAGGVPVQPGNLKPVDLVTIPGGMRTSVAVAEK